MSNSNDRRDDQMRELECLRLASELRQLAKETLSPDLKAHCLRMAKQWSDEADVLAQDNTEGDEDLIQ
jgi:hypothetical protein